MAKSRTFLLSNQIMKKIKAKTMHPCKPQLKKQNSNEHQISNAKAV